MSLCSECNLLTRLALEVEATGGEQLQGVRDSWDEVGEVHRHLLPRHFLQSHLTLHLHAGGVCSPTYFTSPRLGSGPVAGDVAKPPLGCGRGPGYQDPSVACLYHLDKEGRTRRIYTGREWTRSKPGNWMTCLKSFRDSYYYDHI